MISINFNNKNSYTDLGITIDSFGIQPPAKKKIKESVPFMNGSYDFSTVGSNGEITYSERVIRLKFNLIESNRASLWNKYSEVLEWLLGVGQSQLIFSDMIDCYYLAEVEDAPSFETLIKNGGIMEVEFITYPFKFGTNIEGSNQLWDPFNFELDYMQDTELDVVGSEVIQIYNVGKLVSPVVNCSSNMSVVLNGYTANFTTGDNTDWRFKLKPGINNITVTGTGTIKFIFRKELL